MKIIMRDGIKYTVIEETATDYCVKSTFSFRNDNGDREEKTLDLWWDKKYCELLVDDNQWMVLSKEDQEEIFRHYKCPECGKFELIFYNPNLLRNGNIEYELECQAGGLCRFYMVYEFNGANMVITNRK